MDVIQAESPVAGSPGAGGRVPIARRLAETHGAGLEAAAEFLSRQADHRRRAGMLAGAADLGRTAAQADLDVNEAEDWIRAKFGGDDEATA